MDTPTQRMIRIGKTSIGLLGLDIAINKALAAEMAVPQAVDCIFRAVKEQNYIPAAMVEKYREAIGHEYRRLLGSHDDQDHGPASPAIPGSQGIKTSLSLTIRILGSGCISCNGLQTMVINAMERAGVAADIEQIHDRDEIGRLGITATPALIINGQVKISGIMPTLAQVEGWIREVLPHND
jgi:small redox-active disulfide protein 2